MDGVDWGELAISVTIYDHFHASSDDNNENDVHHPLCEGFLSAAPQGQQLANRRHSPPRARPSPPTKDKTRKRRHRGFVRCARPINRQTPPTHVPWPCRPARRP